MQPKGLVQSRPAETGAIGAAVAVLIAYFAGLDDPAIITALAVVVGAIPGVITWLVVTIRKKP
jgi:uncharacterized YccA/Bax inhibitor family protein